MIRERLDAIDDDEIGVQALRFIASHQALIDKFVEITGFDPGDLRRFAKEPSFFVAILDFFLAFDPMAPVTGPSETVAAPLHFVS